MCDSILIDGHLFSNFGEVSKRLGVPMIPIEIDGDSYEPNENECLCSADIPKMAAMAGMNCREADWDNHPFISYIVEKRGIMKKTTSIVKLLNALEATRSFSEGRRLVGSDAIKLNGFPVRNTTAEADFFVGDIIELGKTRRFEVKEEDLQKI